MVFSFHSLVNRKGHALSLQFVVPNEQSFFNHAIFRSRSDNLIIDPKRNILLCFVNQFSDVIQVKVGANQQQVEEFAGLAFGEVARDISLFEVTDMGDHLIDELVDADIFQQ